MARPQYNTVSTVPLVVPKVKITQLHFTRAQMERDAAEDAAEREGRRRLRWRILVVAAFCAGALFDRSLLQRTTAPAPLPPQGPLSPPSTAPARDRSARVSAVAPSRSATHAARRRRGPLIPLCMGVVAYQGVRTLNTTLRSAFRGLPSMPGKSTFGSSKDLLAQAESRREGLTAYLRTLLADPA